MEHLFRDYLENHHGYWVLFVWTFLEGEAGLILAGFLAYQGYLSLPAVIVTAAGGAFLGDQFYFYLGRWQGKWLLKAFTLIARKFRKALRLIERYGTFVAFVSRYTYGFRIILPIILGMSTFSAPRFLWLNVLSALAWALIFSMAGYIFGKSASLFVEDVGRYEIHLLAVLAGLIFSMWLLHLVHAQLRRKPARQRLKRMRDGRKAREER
ncbi:DedA family protein [Geobacter sp.]|uniref:DedA family protein n=1 Tax=Geobacter sp. TaxID=46610 RepID=UPI00261D244D|nr:DedA family protein [Geobacter sp.]